MKKMTEDIEGTKMMDVYCKGGMARPLTMTAIMEENNEEVLRQTYKLTDSEKFSTREEFEKLKKYSGEKNCR